MILNQRNININNILLINFVFGFFPISFILGNFITNINIVLFCCLGIFHLRSKILTTKFDLSIKIIFLFFLIIFFSTSLSFIKSLYLQEYEYIDLVRLVKSIAFFRFFLLLIIVYLLSEFDILNFKYFLLSATFVSLLVSLDIIYQYNFGFDLIGLKSLGTYNSGFFGDELIAGGFIKNFSFFTIFFVAFSLRDKNILRYILMMFVICILGVGIMLSGNRMPLILFLLGLLLIFLFDNKLKKILLASFLVLFIIFGFIFSFDSKIKDLYVSYIGNAQHFLISVFSDSKNEELKRVIEKELKKQEVAKLKEKRTQKKTPAHRTSIDESRYEWETFLNPPKWEEGDPVKDDFEFFWVLQNEWDPHNKLFVTALDIWGNNKIFGNGIKSFREDCKKLVMHKKGRLCSNHPHNYYLEILTDTGIVGFFVTLAIGLLFVVFIFKNFKFLNVSGLKNLILLAATMSLILEAFPIKSTGSIFTTNNATYLILIGSIILSHNKLLSGENFG